MNEKKTMGFLQIIPLISLRERRGLSKAGGTSQSSSRGPGAVGWAGWGAVESGWVGGGAAGVAAQPQAACAAHPGAAVSWSPAPAARRRLI